MGVSSFNPRNLLQINSNEGFLGRTPHMNCMLWFRRLCFKAQTQLTVPGHPGPLGSSGGNAAGEENWGAVSPSTPLSLFCEGGAVGPGAWSPRAHLGPTQDRHAARNI